MNKDKENRIVRSKIPIPIPPLPALPQRLLKKTIRRAPLNTLAGPNDRNANLAGPSNEQKQYRKASPFKLDRRFVTIKRGCDEYNDSGYLKAFDADRRTSEPSVIYISDDDEDKVEPGEQELSIRRASTTTPAQDELQTLRIRKIKRSLKRPHSRELQGISPGPNQDGLVAERVKRRLNFKLSANQKIEAWVPHDIFTDCLAQDYSDEIFSYLLQTEVRLPSPTVNNEARACVINWLMKINVISVSIFGDGNPATIQIAIWYLDKLLSTSKVTLENMQLVAAASFWIATKIEGPVLSASRLVKYSNNAFSTKRLVDAESLILEKLKFPSSTVVPQNFVGYLAWRCNGDRPWEVAMAASFLCLCGMMVNKNLCKEYPSVVAAAAIRCALLLLRKEEMIPSLQKCYVYVAAENKAKSLKDTCVILRRAVRTVASQKYPYKHILNIFGSPPSYIAQTIVNACNELSLVDTKSFAV